MSTSAFPDIIKFGQKVLQDLLQEALLIQLDKIPLKRAVRLYEKFLASGLAKNNLILHKYTLNGKALQFFQGKISSATKIRLHLVIVKKDYHNDLTTQEEHLQFAFEFNNEPKKYYLLFNCSQEIKVCDFLQIQSDFIKILYSQMSEVLERATFGVYKDNTKMVQINLIDISKSPLMAKMKSAAIHADMYLYPSIITATANDLVGSIKQFRHFSILLSTHEITTSGAVTESLTINQAIAGSLTIDPVAEVDDKYNNCPPLCEDDGDFYITP